METEIPTRCKQQEQNKATGAGRFFTTTMMIMMMRDNNVAIESSYVHQLATAGIVLI
jgi:hypothetical protein